MALMNLDRICSVARFYYFDIIEYIWQPFALRHFNINQSISLSSRFKTNPTNNQLWKN